MEQTNNVIDFKPKDGKQPQWKYIYEALKDYEYDKELSYHQLETMTGFSKQKIQMLKDKVDRELKQSHKKMLVNVRGFGYKIADPWSQVKEAQGHEKKGNRQIRRARVFLDNLDTSQMSSDEKNRIIDYTNHIETKLRLVRKKNIESLDLSKKAAKETKKSEKAQENSVKELDSLLGQINDLKAKLTT